MSHQAPTLHTDRLTLRAHTRQDFEPLRAIWSDLVVTRHIGGKPASDQDCWFRLMRYMGLWSLVGYGYWAVCDTRSGTYLGDVGMADFRRNIGPAFDDTPEAGWVLSPSATGRGLATEAIQAALAWHDNARKTPRTVCMIDPENLASIRVAEKARYSFFQQSEHATSPANLYERLR